MNQYIPGSLRRENGTDDKQAVGDVYKENFVSTNGRLAFGFPLSFLSAVQFAVQNMPSFSVSEETLVSNTKAATSKIPESGDTIPPATSKRERTLVLCFDGTGDQ